MLVVEDEHASRLLIERMLSSLGYQPDFVNDGHQSLKSLEQSTYDMIWMDIRLPTLDGVEATKLIRALYPDQALYIIAITAHVFARDKDDYLKAGMDDLVSKPYTRQDLKEAIVRFIQRSDPPS